MARRGAKSSWVHNPSDTRSRFIPIILNLSKEMTMASFSEAFIALILFDRHSSPVGLTSVFTRFCPSQEPENHASDIQNEQRRKA